MTSPRLDLTTPLHPLILSPVDLSVQSEQFSALGNHKDSTPSKPIFPFQHTLQFPRDGTLMETP